MADRKRHCEYRQPKGERHSQQSNTHSWKSGRQDSTAASPEDEPECPDKFRRATLLDIHVWFPVVTV